MIDNGNGNGSGNSGENSGPVLVPGPHGGMLRRGNPGNSGRPRSKVRNMLVDEFAEQIPELKKELAEGKITRMEFATLCARFGLGTTITETDAEGNDAIRVVREPRTLVNDDV